MLCHAKALFPASTNSGGMLRRARTASLSAARSVSSSSQPLATVFTPRLLHPDVLGLVGEDGDQMPRTAQPVQAAGTHRSDAAHRHAQSRADVDIGGRWI